MKTIKSYSLKSIQLTVIINFLIIFRVFAVEFPGTQWSSERISDTVLGVKLGPVTQSMDVSWVVLTPHHLKIYTLSDNKLTEIYSLESKDEWIKLNLFDVDEDGVKEIIVTGFRNSRVVSQVGQFRDNKINFFYKTDGYLQVVGEKLFFQAKMGDNDFTGPLKEMKWDGKKLVELNRVTLPGGLSGESPSIYSLLFTTIDSKETLLRLNDSGNLVVYEKAGEKWKQKWVSGESYGGSVYYLNKKVKNILNETTESRFFVPLFFQMKSDELVPSICLIKNNDYLKSVMGAVPSIKNTQLVCLKWTGYGFQEYWNSPRLDGAVADFDFLDWNGEQQIVASLLLRDKGYADTLKKQDSLLVILKINQ